jgi:hypothetical protein
MKRKIAMLLLATVSAVFACGAYTVNLTGYTKYYFEDGGVVNPNYPENGNWGNLRKNEYSYADSAYTLSKSGDSFSIYAVINDPHWAIKDWGLTTSYINTCEWTGNSSVNFTHTYDSKYKNSGTLYLHLWLRWYRYSLSFNSNGAGDVSSINDICYTNKVTLPTLSRTGYTFNGWTKSSGTQVFTGTKTGADLGADIDGMIIPLSANGLPKRTQ